MKRGLFATIALVCGLALPEVRWVQAGQGPPAVPAAGAQVIEVLQDRPDTAVVLVEDHRGPLVEVVLQWPAGRWSPWARRLHAEDGFMIQLYDPAGALRRRAEALAVTLWFQIGDESSEVHLRCLKEDLGPALGLLADVLAQRDFDPGELQRRRYGRPALWRGQQRDPQRRILREIALRTYGPGDPRRLFAEAPATLLTDSKKLAAARDRMLRLPGRVIGFVGDLSPAQARALSARLLPAALPAPADLAPVLPALRGAAAATEAVVLKRLNQVHLAYYRDGLGMAHRDYPLFLIANQILAGRQYLRSRLSTALRIEGASTYSAYGVELEDFAEGAYYLTTFTRVLDADEIERRLREVVQRFQRDGITEQERGDAVDYLRGHRALQRRTPEDVLSRYLFEHRHGVPSGWQDQLIERAAAVPLSEINAFIRRFYDPAHFRLLKLGPVRS